MELREQIVEISIHALREEGDVSIYGTPAGKLEFQSTPSARRATDAVQRHDHHGDISIHALREEGDRIFYV